MRLSQTEEELQSMTKHMMDVLTRNEATIRQYKGVLTTGIGFREKRGKDSLGEPCIYIEVEKKMEVKDLDPSQVLPLQIEDLPVDIREVIFISNLVDFKTSNTEEYIPGVMPDQSVYRPMLSGCQITDNITGKGTAGIFGHSPLSSSDNIGFLTCKHVLPDQNNNTVYQPYALGYPAIGEVIFRAYELIPGGGKRVQLDVAICQLNTGIKANNQLVGEDSGFTIKDNSPIAYMGQKVIKYGRSTRKTEGTVAQLGAYVSGTSFHTSISILGLEKDPLGNCEFAEGGDSGSALLTPYGNVLGINCQVYSTHPSFMYTAANDIGYIKSKLGDNLKFPLPPNLTNMLIAEDTARLAAYQRLLFKSEGGQKFLAAFLQFYAEGKDLIMNNRECMVTWIRNAGPTFVRLRKQNFSSDHYHLVKEANGHTLTELLQVMYNLFIKYGSPAFVSELKNYEPAILLAFEGADTLENVITRLSEIFTGS